MGHVGRYHAGHQPVVMRPFRCGQLAFVVANIRRHLVYAGFVGPIEPFRKRLLFGEGDDLKLGVLVGIKAVIFRPIRLQFKVV